MLKRRHSKKRFLVVVVAIAISLVAILVSRQNVQEEIQVQLMGNLKDVSTQNEVTMERLLNDKQNMLKAIASEISESDFSLKSTDEIWQVVDWLENYNVIYGFKRMGVIMPDGSTYTTDGHTGTLSDEPYQYGMQGLANVSGVIEDEIGKKEDINVFSVPIFEQDGTTVKGVLFATYRTEDFKQFLEFDSFDGEGYCYIVRINGSVIADSAKSAMYGTTNVFSKMLAYSADNKDVVNRLMSAMEKGESGYETFYTDSERSLYYTPLKVSSINQTWYLFTIIPTSILDSKSETVIFYQDILVLVITMTISGLAMFFAITYRRDEKLLRMMAYIDPLTNGYNQHAFNTYLTMHKINYGHVIAVDINDFKLVNRVCGINKGNETIVRMGQILKECLKDKDALGHIGGDHFVMYFQEVDREKLQERIALITEKLEGLTEELGVINISPYFGIYEIKESADPEECYNCANQAKKLVKGNKAKNWAFYDELDFQKAVDDKNIADSFKSAIENNEFEIWYQPKYRGNKSNLVGAEALVRWRKSDGTLVPPYRFIPLFERNGMIVTLDEYVFEKVCRQQKKWEEEGYDMFPVSVNISRASMYFGNIVERYRDIITACGVNPEKVPLEITESAMVNNAQIKGLVEEFRDAGFSLHLDDFGSGYSSLATINLIHFDVLKMDKTLIDFIGNKSGEMLVEYTINLAKGMGMKVTAEGVETEEQLDFLNDLDCDDVQGYYFSKPLPLEEFCGLLKNK